MNKFFSVALCGVGMGLLSLAAPVYAQNSVIDTNFHIVNADVPSLFGDFHVHIFQTGNQEIFTVTPLGGTITDASVVTATSFLLPDGLGNPANTKLTVDSASGGTTAPYNVQLSGANTTVTFAQQDGAAFLSNATFHGVVTFTPGQGPAQSIRMSIADGGSQTRTLNFQATPEASSLALLLPGLIPVGLAFRRRRAKRA